MKKTILIAVCAALLIGAEIGVLAYGKSAPKGSIAQEIAERAQTGNWTIAFH